MNFIEYQIAATDTAQYPQAGNNLVYPMLGLVGEAGEAADKVKKIWRNRGVMSAHTYTLEEKRELAKELGDILWYIAAAATEIEWTLESIAVQNIQKLMDRQERNVIKSEGDNR